MAASIQRAQEQMEAQLRKLQVRPSLLPFHPLSSPCCIALSCIQHEPLVKYA